MHQYLKSLMTAFIILSLFPAGYAQTYADLKEKPYRAWSYPMQGNPINQGYLLFHSDSIIVLKDLSFQHEFTIPLSRVHRLRFRRTKRGAKGILFGALIGTGLGVMSGLIAGDDGPPAPSSSGCQDIVCALIAGLGKGTQSAERKAFNRGFLGLIAGAGVGAVVASTKSPPVYLYGNPAAYRQVRGELVKYTLKF